MKEHIVLKCTKLHKLCQQKAHKCTKTVENITKYSKYIQQNLPKRIKMFRSALKIYQNA